MSRGYNQRYYTRRSLVTPPTEGGILRLEAAVRTRLRYAWANTRHFPPGCNLFEVDGYQTGAIVPEELFRQPL